MIGLDVPAGGFRAIYADPPWAFRTFSGENMTPHRCAEDHYRTMDLGELKALPIADVAARDCALFMWIVGSHLAESIELAAAWGFTFKTDAFYWLKQRLLNADQVDLFTGDIAEPRMGFGYWTRKQVEPCWLFTRGKPARLAKGVRQVIVEPHASTAASRRSPVSASSSWSPVRTSSSLRAPSAPAGPPGATKRPSLRRRPPPSPPTTKEHASMADLFEYPHAPGAQDRDTSSAAAAQIAPVAGAIRARVLDRFERSSGMTADECAGKLGLSILTVRPRVTELARLGKLRDSGQRRLNGSGRPAIVWGPVYPAALAGQRVAS